MANVHDIQAEDLVEKSAEKLKEIPEVNPPEWANFVKTGTHKQKPPVNKDWWYLRAASVLRTIYKLGPIGVSKLRRRYGGKKNRGFRPERFYKGSGSIIRKILQQLEAAGFVKKVEKQQHKGRIISPKGKSFLDKLATQLSKGSKKQVKQQVKEEPKVEEKPEVKKEEPKKEEKPKEVKKEAPKPAEKKEEPKKESPKKETKNG